MTFESFKEQAFAHAKALKCDNAELYYTKQEKTEICVLESEIDSYSQSISGGVNLRVVVNGKTGYAYSEVMENAEALVKRAMDNAAVIESSDERPMQGPCDYPAITQPKCEGADYTVEQIIAFAKKLEADTKAKDKRVLRMVECGAVKSKSNVRICNTLGLNAQAERSDGQYLVYPVLEENGVVKDSYAFRFGEDFNDVDGCIAEAVDGASEKFGAKSAASGTYSILMRHDAMESLLSAFWPVFSADLAQKKLSLLAGKEGEKVAADCVNITDDPMLKKRPRAFDAEGVPSVKTSLIENGILKSFLHDMKTAKKAGCASTSNGGRSSADSAVTVMPSNLFINAGSNSFDELMKQMNGGIVITQVSGTHSGVSTVSGDFSLIAGGYLVENGVKVRPVEQITIAGNFLTMLKGVKAVGSDLHYGMPSASLIGAPSVLIDSLVVSGE